jgi:hypothetical protein
MREFILVAAALLNTSCAGSGGEACERISSGAQIYVDRHARGYDDISHSVASGSFDNLIAGKAIKSGHLVNDVGLRPKVCKVKGGIVRSIGITYPPRRAQDVGANVDLYYGADGRVLVAEFYVTPKMP